MDYGHLSWPVTYHKPANRQSPKHSILLSYINGSPHQPVSPVSRVTIVYRQVPLYIIELVNLITVLLYYTKHLEKGL